MLKAILWVVLASFLASPASAADCDNPGDRCTMTTEVVMCPSADTMKKIARATDQNDSTGAVSIAHADGCIFPHKGDEFFIEGYVSEYVKVRPVGRAGVWVTGFPAFTWKKR